MNYTSTGKPLDFKNGIRVIGLMSGTSLDGLDICYAEFKLSRKKWEYNIIKADDESYPLDIKNRLATAQNMSALDYALFNSDYGLYLGKSVKAFIDKHKADPHIIASHGSTVFHQPKLMFTAQIGSGAGIAAETGVDCVCDFRTTDVALHGQGAPLVPIGDRTLFGDFEYCLNLGGFSNISFESKIARISTRLAYDICPVNYVLNYYTRPIGLDYDKDGKLASKGKICYDLLTKLNSLPFYTDNGPKSLGREWVEAEVLPLINSFKLPLEDILATFCEHIAMQISKHIKNGKVLLTGGGAFNKFLVNRMRVNAPQCVFYIPDKQTINFKEALIFAFLGVLYLANIPNCISSVTGASYNCIGGALYKAGGSF